MADYHGAIFTANENDNVFQYPVAHKHCIQLWGLPSFSDIDELADDYFFQYTEYDDVQTPAA